VVISVSTERFDSAKRILQIDAAVNRLVNRALCHTR
jgi:hypothetical protein